MMTSQSIAKRHHVNISVFELHIQKLSCIQKLKVILAFKFKNSAYFTKNKKNVVYDLCHF